MRKNFNDFLAVSPTRSRAFAAFTCYSVILISGIQEAKDLYPKSTWYRHLSIIRDAGITLDDLESHHLDFILQSKGQVL